MTLRNVLVVFILQAMVVASLVDDELSARAVMPSALAADDACRSGSGSGQGKFEEEEAECAAALVQLRGHQVKKHLDALNGSDHQNGTVHQNPRAKYGERCDKDWDKRTPKTYEVLCEQPYECDSNYCVCDDRDSACLAQHPPTGQQNPRAKYGELCDEDWDDRNPNPFEILCEQPYECDHNHCVCDDRDSACWSQHPPTGQQSPRAKYGERCDGDWDRRNPNPFETLCEQPYECDNDRCVCDDKDTACQSQHPPTNPRAKYGERCDEDWDERNPKAWEVLCEPPLECDHGYCEYD